MALATELVIVERRGAAGWLTLNRPHRQDIDDFRRHWSNPELREGIAAFRQQREPRWTAA